jgi:hypothetical protein
LLSPAIRVVRSIWRSSGSAKGERAIPEETAIALRMYLDFRRKADGVSLPEE